MDTLLLLTILIVICALVFDFINGFHDTANAIATSVSTKALKPRHAIVMAAIMNFLGAMTFTGVAKTITKDIVNPYTLDNGSVVILAALLAAIAWNLITWYFGIPSSSSHAIIGAIAGAAIAASGFATLNYKGFIKILEALILSPIIAFVLGFIVYSIVKLIFKDSNLAKTNKRFRRVQILTAAIQSYTHGTNDAQKAMGIITMALMTANLHKSDAIPFWVQLSCALAMGLGTSIGGWKIIKIRRRKNYENPSGKRRICRLNRRSHYFRGHVYSSPCQHDARHFVFHSRCGRFPPRKRRKLGNG
ncbi:PiT family inorganic phosphate transporter [Bacillus velezensis]|nr:PiT family inorganic phosphate transporter [Bacillus velezensis]